MRTAATATALARCSRFDTREIMHPLAEHGFY
jgi:hypothetical protein